MPGPHIHMSSMRHAAARLSDGFSPPKSGRIPSPALPGADPQELARLLTEDQNFASLGAIGPDPFFFLPDFRDIKVGGQQINLSSVLVGVLDFLSDMYDTLDPFINKYERYLGPLSANAAMAPGASMPSQQIAIELANNGPGDGNRTRIASFEV